MPKFSKKNGSFRYAMDGNFRQAGQVDMPRPIFSGPDGKSIVDGQVRGLKKSQPQEAIFSKNPTPKNIFGLRGEL